MKFHFIQRSEETFLQITFNKEEQFNKESKLRREKGNDGKEIRLFKLLGSGIINVWGQPTINIKPAIIRIDQKMKTC